MMLTGPGLCVELLVGDRLEHQCRTSGVPELHSTGVSGQYDRVIYADDTYYSSQTFWNLPV